MSRLHHPSPDPQHEPPAPDVLPVPPPTAPEPAPPDVIDPPAPGDNGMPVREPGKPPEPVRVA